MNPSAFEKAARVINGVAKLRPTLAIVLGSGFHGLTSRLDVQARVPYAKIPGFPQPGVPGHSGELLLGILKGTPVAVLSGRAHYYEGHDLATIAFGVRTMVASGITDLLLTNAAGGINKRFRPGDLMLLTDHINFMGVNPLRGPNLPGRERFIDLTQAYDPELGSLMKAAARRVGVKLRSGVYLAVSGPSYETPAEIRAFGRLGADAVGMSTVPETIVARQCGLRVAALSCITNLAAGVSPNPLSHAEVLETGRRVENLAAELLSTFAELYAKRR